MHQIPIGRKKYPLYWDLYAHEQILKAAADAGYENLGAWIDAEPLKSYGTILYELMCGGIRKQNMEITMGYRGGKKLEMPSVAASQRHQILSLVNVAAFPEIQTTINLCWSESSRAEIPKALQQYMPDDDYMEIAEEIEREKPDSEKN